MLDHIHIHIHSLLAHTACTHPQGFIPLFSPPEDDVGTADPCECCWLLPMTCYSNAKQGGNPAHEGSKAATGNCKHWPPAAMPCMQEMPSPSACSCPLPQLYKVCFSPSTLVMCKSRLIRSYSLHFLKQLLDGEESATYCPWHWHERLQINSRGYMHALGVTRTAQLFPSNQSWVHGTLSAPQDSPGTVLTLGMHFQMSDR